MLWRRNIKHYTFDLESTEKKKKKKKKDFFVGGFGFVGRDDNKGVDLVLQVTSWNGFGFAVGLFFFFLFFFSFFLLLLLLFASFFFLCCSSSFLRSVNLNRVHET